MDRYEFKLRELFLETPTQKWPVLAKAMAWERGTGGPPWMDSAEREWFWVVVDLETAKAAKQAEFDASMERFWAALLAPWVRFRDWLLRRLA